MKTWNRIAKGFVLTTIAATLLSACGTKKDAAEVSTTSIAPAASVSTEQKKETTIQVLAWMEASDARTKKLIQTFEDKNQGIKVNYSSVGTDNYATALKTKLLTDDGPDVFASHPGSEFSALAGAQFTVDITNLSFVKAIQEGALKAVTLNDKVYGIPVAQNVIGVFYNKKVFNDVGIPSVPTTWAEFIAVCDKIKAKGVSPLSFANGDWPKNLPAYPLLSTMVLAANPNWYNDRNAGKVSFTEWTPIYDRYQVLLKNYTLDGYKGALGVKYDQHFSNVTSGKAAMLIQGSWAFADLKKVDPEAQIGFFPLNGTDDPNQIIVPQGIGYNWSVYSGSKHKEAAQKFLEYMTTADSIIDGDIPVISGVKAIPEYIKENMLKYLETGKTSVFLDVPFPAGFGDKVANTVDHIITLDGKPSELLKEWDKAWDEAVKKQLEQQAK